ncbi:hypothetical protein [Streptomyces sp. NPDC048191]
MQQRRERGLLGNWLAAGGLGAPGRRLTSVTGLHHNAAAPP